MQVVPYRLLGASTLGALSARVQEVLAAWARDWGVQAALVQVDVCAASEAPAADAAAAQWQRRYGAGEACLHVARDMAWMAQLEEAMFPGEPGAAPDSIAASAAQEAAGALVDALSLALLGPKAAVEASLARPPVRPGSGSAAIRLTIGGEQLRCTVNDQTVRAAAGALPAAVPLARLGRIDWRALFAPLPASLRVEGGLAKVNLASLLTLAPGDVIRLDSLVEHALLVRNADGKHIFSAFLGSLDGQIGIEVIRK